ncbi:uncharacterized protein MELLADRAFT_93833 [Melampsora larici-populina 98AG31]|uniref:CCHC-type domain-containing protein n=1 Tax=Melampsora larici-populina (strain 98AG31 / pathotype 3-4-7) TaxID=747676 RepID=F4S5F0_MELLP|nr:uncharacterized protein MELLADRAFT_93833 [Melampsora larici-populina 98AG31]EGG00174.1 hypothetical protein MELLADRAFT_93833 [Melampsora larici-populina 98AG31]
MITNPDVRSNGRGRPKLDAQKRRSKSSTARYQSDFDVLEKQNKRSYKCGQCGGNGHKANNCTAAQRQAASRHPMPELPRLTVTKTSKCSQCNQTGHQANRCPRPQQLTNEEKSLDDENEQDIPAAASTSSVFDLLDSSLVDLDDSDDSDDQSDIDERKCPLCDDPLPKQPSKKFQEQLQFHLAKPHAKKRPLPGNPEAVDLPNAAGRLHLIQKFYADVYRLIKNIYSRL